MNYDSIPPLLRAETERFWQNYQQQANIEQQNALCSGMVGESLAKVWACSSFIAKTCAREPALLTDLLESGDLIKSYHGDNAAHTLNASVPEGTDEATLHRILRLWRRREMVRIAWRDLAGWANLDESFRDLSALADAAVLFVNNYYYAELSQRFGIPCDHSGQPQILIALAMGKLGGRELNFSSDIDLIFVYPAAGNTQGGHKQLSNQEFFVRLGQKIIQALDNVSADGFVFRVDMRLRPFGDSGPLAMSFTPLEEYYQGNAREWERYALIKARPIGSGKEANTLMESLRPFVYRRYLDYGAFEALRELKTQIDQEVRRKGHDNDIKLGLGGIREIEFICQAFQLLRGGRLRALQTRHLLDTLAVMELHTLLPRNVIAELRAAYCFLRASENRLQAMHDSQTQRLPDNEMDQARLALAMDYDNWHCYLSTLKHHRQTVHQHYREVIAGGGNEHAPTPHPSPLAGLWHSLDSEHALSLLSSAGFNEPEAIHASLLQLQHSYSVRHMSRRGQQRLDALMPLLFEAVQRYHHPDIALPRVLKLLEQVALRSVYLPLLIEHPQALTHLVQLCADSAWIAEQLTRYPLLLDELLDPRRLFDPLKPEELDSAAQAQLAHLPLDDLEAQMDTLRQFKRAQVLHVAAAELTGKLTVEIASDYLTAIAECILRQALSIAWEDLAHKHGRPMCDDGTGVRPAHFAIIAYGKAGGIEMSYSSDLDIIFLHDSSGTQQFTDGNKSLDNHVFFARLAKRIIHLLTTPTSAGVLYEVDARLRPGGNSGLMVSSLEAFHHYQQHEAWTWEHQALVRARAVVGDIECMIRFEDIRAEILQQQRDEEILRTEVKAMRAKMRTHLDKSTDDYFDLKQGIGGITDIEFMVQYGVLRWADAHPSLLETTGMLPMLRRFQDRGLFSAEAVEALSQGYRHYRSESHRLALQSQNAIVEKHCFSALRTGVYQVWQELLGETESSVMQPAKQ
jgi:[glutamine synthetase] adenylyltransferase / [glutamine synthetase]-adenylyl-L-tyrosine phosphorylase